MVIESPSFGMCTEEDFVCYCSLDAYCQQNEIGNSGPYVSFIDSVDFTYISLPNLH